VVLHLPLLALDKGADAPSGWPKGTENRPHIVALLLQVRRTPSGRPIPATGEGLTLDRSGDVVEFVEYGRRIGRPAQHANEAEPIGAGIGARRVFPSQPGLDALKPRC
jgi:hypothetical protein